MGAAMAQVSLLRMGGSATERATYAFEHAMATRTLYGAMSPISQFSVLPYYIDPQQAGGMYRLRHQQAHWDALSAIPSYPPGIGVITIDTPAGQTVTLPEIPGRVTNTVVNIDGSTTTTFVPSGAIAQGSDQPLADREFTKIESPWWIFANHIEHYNAMDAYPLAEDLTFPFW